MTTITKIVILAQDKHSMKIQNIMIKAKTNKNQPLVDLITSRGIKRTHVAKTIGVSYNRMILILRGADPYLHEGLNLSKVLNTSIDELFPHLFHTQSKHTAIHSHE